MRRAEYLLLDYVVEFWCPLVILADEDCGAVLNKPDHGLGYSELINVLYNFFENGYLIAKNDLRGKFVPTRKEIEIGLKRDLGIYYGLTADGGDLWEAYSKPNWKRYIYEAFTEEEGEVISMDRQRVECYLSGLKFIGITPVSGSEAWDTLEPWEATYWKTLPVGHRVRFRYVENVEEWEPVPQWFIDMRKWYIPLY